MRACQESLLVLCYHIHHRFKSGLWISISYSCYPDLACLSSLNFPFGAYFNVSFSQRRLQEKGKTS